MLCSIHGVHLTEFTSTSLATAKSTPISSTCTPITLLLVMLSKALVGLRAWGVKKNGQSILFRHGEVRLKNRAQTKLSHYPIIPFHL